MDIRAGSQGIADHFHVDTMPYPSFGTVPVHLALGLVAGCLGVVYNRAIEWVREHGGKGVHFSGKGLREHGARWADTVSRWLDGH